MNAKRKSSDRPPRAVLLSYSPVADDPRVRRQGDALTAAGWVVTAIGLDGARSPAPKWRVIEVPAEPYGRSAGMGAPAWSPARIRRLITMGTGAAMLAAGVRSGKLHDQAFPALPGFLQASRGLRTDLWLANDWPVLPLAKACAEASGATLAYDTHELAIEEYAHSWKWRWTRGALVRDAEQPGIKSAALVSCVSDGIADKLVEYYDLRQRPMVVRSMPPYVESHWRSPAAGEPIRMLYHGLVAPGRGLEQTIASAPYWRPAITLAIRGPSDPIYLDCLRRNCMRLGVADRVSFLPPVTMTELVEAARAFDVGFFAIAGNTTQNKYVLPNKFFEYVMAGLALCVSDLPEMARHVRAYDLGVLMADIEPSTVAEAVNSLDHTSIARFRANARRAAAGELNWEREAERFVAACSRLVA